MPVRLRQICLLAESLPRAIDEIGAALSLTVRRRDPEVAAFGLENAVMEIGDGFLEVVAPVAPDAPARRHAVSPASRRRATSSMPRLRSKSTT